MNKKIIIIGVVAIVAIVGVVLWSSFSDKKDASKLSVLAKCINESGAKFYGAFWCSHCQDQKAMFRTLFGSAEDDLPYIECSTPDSGGQLDVCRDAGIKGYPTWTFADDTTYEGQMTLAQLAEKTGCPTP